VRKIKNNNSSHIVHKLSRNAINQNIEIEIQKSITVVFNCGSRDDMIIKSAAVLYITT